MILRNIRGAKRKAAIQDLNSIVRKELEQAIEQKVKPALVKSHEIVVANWEHKPKFQSRKFFRPDSIAVNIFPTGENAKIWRFVDEGTRPHQIKAKNAPRLIFQTGYQPKTLARPARTVPSGGRSTGPILSKIVVNHPGSEARNFTEEIAEDIRPNFRKEIENAFRRASRKIKE